MADKYVRKSGSDAEGVPGTTAEPWLTIQHACQQLSAGDTLHIGPGTYNENLSFNSSNAASGTQSNPIVVQAEDTLNRPVVGGGGSNQLCRLIDLSWWTWTEIVFGPSTGSGGFHVTAESANITGVKIIDCKFDRCKPNHSGSNWTILVGSGYNQSYQASYCVVEKNLLYDCSPVGAITWGNNFGGNECITIRGNAYRVLVKDNTLEDCESIGINFLGVKYQGQPDECVMTGNTVIDMRPVIRNGTTRTNGPGQPFYADRPGRCLIEDNIGTSISPIIGGACNFEPTITDILTDCESIIIRNNVFHAGSHNCANIGVSQVEDNLKFNNIQFVHNVVITEGDSIYGQPIQHGKSDNYRVRNSIFLSRNPSQRRVYGTHTTAQQAQPGWSSDGNLFNAIAGTELFVWGNGTYSGLPAFQAVEDANSLVGNPAFVDESNGDYTLDTGSIGLSSGIPLTTTTNAGANSNSMTVGESLYFSDGFGIQGGDVLFIGDSGSEVEVQIIAIDYATDTLTLDGNYTWSIGDAVRYKDGWHMGLTSPVSGGYEPPPPPPPSDCMNSNSSFDNGTTGWTSFFGGTGSWSASGGIASIYVPDTGGNSQIYQDGMSVTQNDWYRCTVRHRSLSGTQTWKAQLFLGSGSLGLNQDISSTASWQDETFTFQATQTTDLGRFRMWLNANMSAGIEVDTFCVGSYVPGSQEINLDTVEYSNLHTFDSVSLTGVEIELDTVEYQSLHWYDQVNITTPSEIIVVPAPVVYNHDVLFGHLELWSFAKLTARKQDSELDTWVNFPERDK